jgi:hypothetical protein
MNSVQLLCAMNVQLDTVPLLWIGYCAKTVRRFASDGCHDSPKSSVLRSLQRRGRDHHALHHTAMGNTQATKGTG